MPILIPSAKIIPPFYYLISFLPYKSEHNSPTNIPDRFLYILSKRHTYGLSEYESVYSYFNKKQSAQTSASAGGCTHKALDKCTKALYSKSHDA